MKKEYYVKIGSMYLYYIEVSSEYPENEFISSIEFRSDCFNCDRYIKEKAEKIREKLETLGFGIEKTFLEEAKPEEK